MNETNLMEAKPFFSNRKSSFDQKIATTKKQINLISTLRLVAIVAIIVLIYFFAQSASYLFLIGAFLVIALFLLLANKHQDLIDLKFHVEALSKINYNELQVLDGELMHLDNGLEFVNTQHDYTYDLDVFGDNSIFQYINRSCTYSGKKRLANILENPLQDIPSIIERQKVIQELSEKVEFRQEFQARGSIVNENPKENDALINWLKEPAVFLNNKFVNVIRFLFPALLVLALIAWLFDSRFMPLFAIMVVINWVVIILYGGKVNAIHLKTSKKNGVLKKYLKLLQVFSKENFTNNTLVQMQSESKASIQEISTIAKIVNRFDQRLNMLVGIVVNTFYLHDLHCVVALEKWREKNRNKIEGWLEVLFEIDALSGLANYDFCNPTHIYPNILEAGLSVQTEGLGHPLLVHQECILNDVELGKSECMIILTGANMSGKSTFLRSLGTNTVLALIGAPVFASKFDCPLLNIMTSMRLTDSLKERASYFYAELKRLQMIVEALEKGEKLLIILDEILKGTNSDDKLTGSIALIEKFVGFNALGMIATHDLELGKLEEELEGKVSNYCFESTIENDVLSFDYKLNKGVAKNKNATFLLKKMKIV